MHKISCILIRLCAILQKYFKFKNLQIRFEDLPILSLNLICSSNLFATITISYLEIFYSEKDGSLLMTRLFKCPKKYIKYPILFFI